MTLLPLLGLGAGGLLVIYGALVAVAARRRWDWLIDHPQVRRAVRAHGQQRALRTLATIGFGVLLLGLLIFLASLAQLNSA